MAGARMHMADGASLDGLADRMADLRAHAGNPSFTGIARGVAALRRARGVPESRCHPGRSTVYDCFRHGRSRVDLQLIADIVTTLGVADDEASRWRAAYVAALRGMAGGGMAGGTSDPAAGAVPTADTPGDVAAGSGGSPAPIGAVQVINPIPAPRGGFVGRRRERSLLRQLGGSPAGARVAVIDGTAGIGKTQFALSAARALVREREPTHQMFIVLRGFDPHQGPAAPEAVIRSILRVAGASGPQAVASGGATLTERCREYLAGDALVVLDDAASAGQVRPILDALAGCTVLVTSRRAIDVPDGESGSPVLSLTLRGLAQADARRMLAAASGEHSRHRVAAEPEAVRRLVEMCGGRPLDLSVTCARIAAKPRWSMADHAAWLAAIPRDEWARPALAGSYHALPDDLRRMFRVLAAHPGPSLTPYTAAALAGTDVVTARARLEELAGEHLLLRREHDRFAFHDAVGAFAQRMAREQDARSDRVAALARVLDYYGAVARAAVARLMPSGATGPPADSCPGPPAGPSVDTEARAREWLTAEHENLVAVAETAGSAGLHDEAAALSSVLGGYLTQTSRWDDAALLHRAALGARDPAVQAAALSGLAALDYRVGRFPEALGRLREVLVITGELADRAGSATALSSLGAVYQRIGKPQQALDAHEQALTIAEDIADVRLQAKVHGNLSVVLDDLGRFEEGLRHNERARELFRQVDDHYHAALLTANQGMVFQRLGRCQEAATAHLEALDVARRLQDRDMEGTVLGALALVQSGLGNHRQAITHARDAVRILDRAGATTSLAHARSDLARVLLGAGRVDDALAEICTALPMARAIASPALEALLLNTRGDALRTRDRSAGAEEAYRCALELATGVDSDAEVAHAHRGLAALDRSRGRTDSALAHARVAYRLNRRMGLPEAATLLAEFPQLRGPEERAVASG